MPGVVEVRRRPGTEAHALTRGLAYLQGSGEAEPMLERSGEAEPLPEGLGEAEPSPERSGKPGLMPEGSGELETFLVGPDRAATTFTIVLDGPRLMSFNFCLMGTLILVPDSSPRAFGRVDYFAKGFFMRGVHEVLAWPGDHGRLVVISDHALGLSCESELPSPARSRGLVEGSVRVSFIFPHVFFR
jgi:hypothetical protein